MMEQKNESMSHQTEAEARCCTATAASSAPYLMRLFFIYCINLESINPRPSRFLTSLLLFYFFSFSFFQSLFFPLYFNNPQTMTSLSANIYPCASDGPARGVFSSALQLYSRYLLLPCLSQIYWDWDWRFIWSTSSFLSYCTDRYLLHRRRTVCYLWFLTGVGVGRQHLFTPKSQAYRQETGLRN